MYAPTYTHGVQREKVLSANVNGDLGQYGIKSPWASDARPWPSASSTAARS
ncbi:hypothetical protein ACRAWD_09645 [Caulobacter segnis]